MTSELHRKVWRVVRCLDSENTSLTISLRISVDICTIIRTIFFVIYSTPVSLDDVCIADDEEGRNLRLML